MAQIFISYAREDRETAEQLADALALRKWRVWWDRDLIAGEQFDEEIEAQLERSSAVVVLWSTSSVGSVWVKGEATVAAERRVLVPVQVELAKVPLQFRGLHTVELTNWSGAVDDPRLDDIQRALIALAGDPNPSPLVADPNPSPPVVEPVPSPPVVEPVPSPPVVEPVPSPPVVVRPYRPPRGRRAHRSRVLVGVGATVGLVGLVLAVWALAGRDDSSSATDNSESSGATSTVDDDTPSVMNPDDVLYAGDFITSPNGEYRLFMQEDGNVTIHRASNSSDVLWATGTQEYPGRRLFMQPDGNLVIYSASRGVWDTRTFVVDSHLELGDDGHLSIVRPDGGTEWTTKVAVPNVVGRSGAEARDALDAAGLEPVTLSVVDDAAAGRVLRTSPEAGEQVFRERSVTVVVSEGPTPASDPTVAPTSSTAATTSTTSTTHPD